MLNDILAQALRNKVTYQIPGVGTVSTEQLFGLSEEQLKEAWLKYRKALKSSDDLLTELDPEAAELSQEDRLLNLRLSVLQAIYQDRKQRNEAARKAVQTRVKQSRRQELIAQRSLIAEGEFIEQLTTDEATDFGQLSVAEQDEAIAMGYEAWKKKNK